jgi:thiamine-monophosphate kinase
VSDGLLADLGHICERSAVDAEIDVTRIPVSPAAAEQFGEAALAMALSGGEDYELICVGPSEALARASDDLVSQGEPALVLIGAMVARTEDQPKVRVRNPDGTERAVDRSGWEHFGGADGGH